MLGASGLAQSALGQGTQSAAGISEALAVTDQRIENAAALLRSTHHPEAEQAVARARLLQAQARDVAGRGGPPRRAVGFTLRARSQADRAIALLRGLPDSDRVLAQLERTHAMLEHARTRLRDCADPDAGDLLREADDVQKRAEAAAAENRSLAALQLTFAARDRGQRALRRCRVPEDVQDTASRAMQATDELIASARATPAPDGTALLERSSSLQAQARDAFRAGRYPLTLRLTTDAGALARRAARLADAH